MFKSITKQINKRRLKDKRFLPLFEKPISNEYVCFDCETTGLDVKKDDVISIGAVIIKDNTILSSKKFVKIIKPKTKLQIEAIKVHHLRECDLENGCEITDILEEFLDFIGNRTLVGYYLEFDIAMMNKYIKDHLGITLPNKTHEVSAIYYDYKMEAIPQGHIDLRFNTIMNDLKIPQMSSHDALNDAIMTSMMFLKLKNMPKVKIR